MEIIRLENLEFNDAFGALFAHAGSWAERQLNFSWGNLGPNISTQRHKHDESELFVILEGEGIVDSDGNCIAVRKGDIVQFMPFEGHVITNISGSEKLIFLDVYWRDKSETRHSVERELGSSAGSDLVYITSTPPTPNGDLHLGHLSGPYLGADVYRRFLQQIGVKALHYCGSDDFQSYVLFRSISDNTSAENTADNFSEAIMSTLKAFDIELNYFARPLRDSHYQESQKSFLHQLLEKGALEIGETIALVDPETSAYLYEVDVSGTCPACGSHTSGNICEECGHPNRCVDLNNPKATRTKSIPLHRSIKRLLFQFARHFKVVKEHHRQVRMAPRLRMLIADIERRGFDQIEVSHPSQWGIAVEHKQLQGQVIWVWLEMIVGMLIAFQRIQGVPAENTELSYPTGNKIVHFFGFDNAFYHTIFFPSVICAAFPEAALNIDYVYNEFLLLDGQKFSTSRQHAIWGREFLNETNSDTARFVLAYLRPENSREDFTLQKFWALVDQELVENWNGWLAALGSRVASQFGATAPDAGEWAPDQIAFYASLHSYPRLMANYYDIDSFSLRSATRTLCELVQRTIAFAKSQQHYQKHPAGASYYRTSIAIELAVARMLAHLSAPLIPRISKQLLDELGADASTKHHWPQGPEIIPGTPVRLSGNYFSRQKA